MAPSPQRLQPPNMPVTPVHHKRKLSVHQTPSHFNPSPSKIQQATRTPPTNNAISVLQHHSQRQPQFQAPLLGQKVQNLEGQTPNRVVQRNHFMQLSLQQQQLLAQQRHLQQLQHQQLQQQAQRNAQSQTQSRNINAQKQQPPGNQQNAQGNQPQRPGQQVAQVPMQQVLMPQIVRPGNFIVPNQGVQLANHAQFRQVLVGQPGQQRIIVAPQQQIPNIMLQNPQLAQLQHNQRVQLMRANQMQQQQAQQMGMMQAQARAQQGTPPNVMQMQQQQNQAQQMQIQRPQQQMQPQGQLPQKLNPNANEFVPGNF